MEESMKTRNPIARSLRSAHLKPKIVRAKKGKGSYRRKKKVTAVDFLQRIA
jgi:stalled ribosome alternative rescue factor ArfA